jgi:hypothetical protein
MIVIRVPVVTVGECTEGVIEEIEWLPEEIEKAEPRLQEKVDEGTGIAADGQAQEYILVPVAQKEVGPTSVHAVPNNTDYSALWGRLEINNKNNV